MTEFSDNWVVDRIIEENRRKSVPGLHPGLNDLIRVLAKQAHCVSRTLILCEPHIPARVRKTKFHKHCSPSKKNKSDSGLTSKVALWTPIRPHNYYYDCFNYTNYPERETDYKDIELTYNAIKENPLHYAPPVCDENKIKRSLESSERKHKKYAEQMFDSKPQKTKKPQVDLESSSTSLAPKLLTVSEEARQNYQPIVQSSSVTETSAGELSDESNTKVKFESDFTEYTDDSRSKIQRKATGWHVPPHELKTAVDNESEWVPCSELLDLQNMIRESDRENFVRMQQMLMLMKELSAKDFCRATCDGRDEKNSYGKGNVTPSGEHLLGEKSHTSSTKSMITPQFSGNKLIKESLKDHLTDSSASSVQSSSGEGLSSEKSKSSTKVVGSSSESSIEKHPIPYLHDTEEETPSSDYEEGPTTSESTFGKPAIGLPSSGSGEKSGQSITRSNTSQKMEATDSSRSFKSDHSGGQMKTTDSSPSFKSEHSGGQMKATDSSPSFKSEHSGGQTNVTDTSRSLKSQHSSAKSNNVNGPNNVLLTVCDSSMTVHELVEVSNIITDILVLETVKELMKNGKYCPPSRRNGGSSPSMISASTSGPPFEVIRDAGIQKSIRIPSSMMKERSTLKSVSLPSPSDLESYKTSKLELLRDDEREPKFEATKSGISGAGSLRSIGSKNSGDDKSGGGTSKVESIQSRTGGNVSGSMRLEETRKDGDDKSGIGSMRSVGDTLKTGSGFGSTKSLGVTSKPESINSKVEEGDVSGVNSMRSVGSRKDGDDKSGIGSLKSVGETSKPGSIKTKLEGDVSGPFSMRSEGSRKDGDDKSGIGSMRSVGETSKPESMKSKTEGDVSGVGSTRSVGSRKDGNDKSGIGSRRSIGETSKPESMKSKTEGDVSGVGSMRSVGSRNDGDDKFGIGSMRSVGGTSKPESMKTGSEVGFLREEFRRNVDDKSAVGSMKSVRETSKPESMTSKTGGGASGVGLLRSVRSMNDGDDKSGIGPMKSKTESAQSKGGNTLGPGVGSSQAESANLKKDISGLASLKSGGTRSRGESIGSKKGDSSISCRLVEEKLKAEKDILGAIGALKSMEATSKAESLRSKKRDDASGMGSLKETSKVDSMKSKMSIDKSGVSSLGPNSKLESISGTKMSSNSSGVSTVGPRSKSGSIIGTKMNSDPSGVSTVGPKSKSGSIGSMKSDGMSAMKSVGESQVGSMKSKMSPESSGVSTARAVISKESAGESIASEGHRRRSSCPKHSRSPSVEVAIKRGVDSSSTSQASADKKRILDVASTSSTKSLKDRREKLTDVTKLSTIDSVCEREESLECVDYETDCTVVHYVRITENAFPPVKESYSAPGFMLKSAYDYTIPARGKVNVKTDLVLELPPGSYGRIAARKCLAVNFGIDVGADVIDRGYRENVSVLLFNHSDQPFPIKKGNKVAQLICESIHQAEAKEKCELLNAD